MPTDHRIRCPRQHQLFQVVAEGIAIKCRAGECKQVYVVTWAELEAMRQQLEEYAILTEKQETVW